MVALALAAVAHLEPKTFKAPSSPFFRLQLGHQRHVRLATSSLVLIYPCDLLQHTKYI